MQLLRRWKTLSPRAILVLGFTLFLIYAFPGYMSTDSANQLVEARTGHFSDGHPPLMAAEWWLLDRIVSGPLLMLLLQGTLFLGGLYYLLRHTVSPRTAAWTAVGIFLYPPVLTTMAVIWKDSQMAAYLVAGTAALLQPRLRVRLGGLGLLVLAAASRHNGFAAALPLAFFLFEWRSGIRWSKRILMSLAIVVVVGLAGFAVTRVLTKTHVTLTTVYPDIVGMIACTDDRSDDELLRVLEGTPLIYHTNIQARARKLHTMNGAFLIVEGDDAMFRNARSPEEWEALYRVRKDLFDADPMSYVIAHWHSFSALLGLDDVDLRAPVWNLFMEEADNVIVGLQHSAGHSFGQQWLGRAFYWLAEETPIFRPYVYAYVALLLLALCCRDRLTAGLLTSGLLYELSFFPVGVNPDYRYSHWMVTATCIAAVILFIQRRRGANAT